MCKCNRKRHALRKGKQMFPSFKEGIDLVKMKMPSKKKALMGSWEGPYLFVGYVNEQVGMEHDDGKIKCIIRGEDEQQWERPKRDL